MYLWPLPATLFGLLFLPLACCTGGRCRIIQGVLEVEGGLLRRVMQGGLPVIGTAGAITLGHVILGQDREMLDWARSHEHIHVRQYEIWGALMIPAYLAASLWAWLRGQDVYEDNVFEREAFRKEGSPTGG